jgi:Putative Ig domain
MDYSSVNDSSLLKRLISVAGTLTVIFLLSIFGNGIFLQSANAVDLNHTPVCSNAHADTDSLWPPNHKFTPIGIQGVTDPDGDPVNITVQCILQDEALNTTGDGNTDYDGDGINTSIASVRSERSGNQNGRVYHIDFIATDSHGAKCGGEVTVSVNHDKNTPAVDDGRLYQSVPSSNTCGLYDINNPPIIYSTPVTFSQSWQPYQYDVDGHDPDGDVLQYSLISAPAGMVMDSASGLITWENPAPGEQTITAQVSDNRGGTDQQTYSLFVNGPPVITSTPLTKILATNVYQYQVTATDPNNDKLTYRLTQAPEGMSIDETTGLIHWIPS